MEEEELYIGFNNDTIARLFFLPRTCAERNAKETADNMMRSSGPLVVDI
jgi:hypothetical protein